MCRWLAYAGPALTLDALLTKPTHSLIDQSWQARQNVVPGDPQMGQFRHHAFPTNGDGFGVGWYGTAAVPGLYRELLPAWSDDNLHRLAEQISSPLFLAHVRATSTGTVQRTNCHPFCHDGWLFQFNGEINGFEQVRADLVRDIDPALLPSMLGNADTEVCFLLALTYGLQHDPARGLARMVGRVERARAEHGIAEPFRATLATTDGTTLWTLRYSSDRASKTLYRSAGPIRIALVDGTSEQLADGAHVLVSEPLERGYNVHHWIEVPEWTLLAVRAGEDPVATAFEPVAA